MAIKKNPIGSQDDSLNLDFDDLDFGDPFAEDTSTKNDKKPVYHLAKKFGAGFGSAMVQPDQVRRVASNALPTGYGTAVNTAYELKDLGANLYHTAAQELRPAMPVFRRTAGALSQSESKLLPKALQRKLKAFSEGGDENRAQHAADAESAEVNGQLDQIFGAMIEENARTREEDRVEGEIRNKIQDKRLVDQARIMDAVRQNTDRLAAYQDNILARYQRKDLELKLRTFALQRNTLALLTAGEQRQSAQLNVIMKNTALPEYRKTDLREAAGANFRDRLLSNYQQKAVDYVTNFTKNFAKNLTASVGNMASQIAGGIDMADMGRESIASAAEMGGDKKGTYAEMLGGLVAPMVTRFVARPIQRHLGKNQKVTDLGSQLQYMFGNIPERAASFVQSADDNTSVAGGLLRWIKEMMPRAGIDPALQHSPLYNANEATPFDKQARRSLVEVIPGFLSRIHHELVKTRTGDANAERTVYNMDRGEFTSFGTAAGDARKRIMHPHQMNYGREQVDKWVTDLIGDHKVSDKTRDELKRQILIDTISGRHYDPKRYSDTESDTANLSYSSKMELEQVLNSNYTRDDGTFNQQRRTAHDEAFRRLKGAIPDPKAAMSVYMETGGREYLKEMGMIDRQGYTDNVNYAHFHDQLFNARPEDLSPDMDPSLLLTPEEREAFRRKSTPYLAPGVAGKATSRLRARARVGYRGAKRRAKDIYNRGSDLYNEAVEVYTQDGKEALVDFAKLKAGEYYDSASGKVITSLDQLRGNLKDQADRVILNAKDLAEGYLSDHPKVQKQLDKAKERAKSLAKKAEKGTRRHRVRAERARRQAMAGLTNQYNKYSDILTNDGERTLLEGVRLAAGDYYDQASGKLIEKWDDISGTVIDNKGNIIAAAKDIARGLKDEEGNTPAWVGKVQAKAQRELKRGAVKGRRAARGARDALNQKKDAFKAEGKRLFDVYVGNGKHPKIEAAALAAGEYFDQASGAVLKSIDDIRGSVVDGEGNIVLSAKDFAKDMYNSAGEQLTSLKTRLRNSYEEAKTAATQAVTAGRDRVNAWREGGDSAAGVEGGMPGFDLTPLIELGQQQVQLQTAILDVLENGDFTSAPGEGGGGGGLGKRLRGLGGRAMGGIGRGLSSMGRGLGGLARAYGRFAVGIWKSPITLARKLGSLGSMAGDYLGDIRNKQGRVIMTRAKMNAGNYWDQLTNKQVRKWRDITGPVEDRSADPAVIVLTAEEYQEGMYDTQGRKLFRATGDVFGRLLKAGGGILGGYASLVAAPFRAISWVNRKIREANAPQDIYVPGDPNPRITVTEMRNGLVFADDRKTKIKRWEQIRGQTFKMVEGTLREALSLEEFKAGLVDYRGKKLKRGNGLINAVGSIGRGLANAAGSIASGYGSLIGGAFKLGGNALGALGRGIGRMFGLRSGGNMTADQATVGLLVEIRDLLKERLPKPKKIRAGSYEERLATFRGRKAEEEAEEQAAEKEKNGFLSKFLSKITGGLFGGGGDDEDDEDGEGGGGGNTIFMGGGGDGGGRGKDGKGAAHRDARGRKRGGMRRNMNARRNKWSRRFGRSKVGRMAGAATGAIGSRLPNWLKRNKGKAAAGVAGAAKKPGLLRRAGGRLARFKPRSASIGGIASGLAMGFGADYAIDKVTGGPNSAGSKAINTGIDAVSYGLMANSLLGGGTAAAGGTALAGGAAGAGTAAAGTAAAGAGGMGVMGTLGTGALAVLGSPVAIGAAIVGAVAYVGYKVYKKYNYGTYTPLRAFRMAQYGYGYQDSDQGKMISELEQMCEPAVKQMGNGLDIAAGGELTMEAVYKLFDLDDGWFTSNKDERAMFDVWFNNRFKPVFLAWLTNVRAIKAQMKLGDADSELSQDQKASLLKAVNNINPQTYNIKAGAFDGKPVEMNVGGVGDAYKLAIDTVEKERSLWGKFKGKAERLGNSSSAGVFGIFGADWATDWIDRQKKASQLKDINARQAEALGKTSAEYEKAKADAAKIIGTAGAASTAMLGNTQAGQRAGEKFAGVGGAKPSGGGGWWSNTAAKLGFGGGAAAAGGGGGGGAPVPEGPPPPALKGSAKELQEMLMKEAIKAGITDKTELAMFLAQCAHESGNFRTISEGYNYSPARAAQIFKKYFRSPAEAEAAMAAGGKRAILDRAYQGRMGNNQPGDGFKFRGRGFIQLTGRDNYAKFAKASGIDVLSNPDLLVSDPKVGAQASIHWWLSRGAGIRKMAAGGDVNGVTKLVNGGTNGLADRASHFKKFMQEMTGNTELNNVRANATTASENSPKTSLGKSEPAYQFSQGVTNGSMTGGVGSAYQQSATSAPSAPTEASNPAAVGRVNYQMPAARPDAPTPTLNTSVMPAPAVQSTRVDEANRTDSDLAKRIQQQQEANAVNDTRSQATVRAEQQETRRMTDIMSKQLDVMTSIDNKVGQLVGFLSGQTGTQVARAAAANADSNTPTSAPAITAQGKIDRSQIVQREKAVAPATAADTPVSMRRNRNAIG